MAGEENVEVTVDLGPGISELKLLAEGLANTAKNSGTAGTELLKMAQNVDRAIRLIEQGKSSLAKAFTFPSLQGIPEALAIIQRSMGEINTAAEKNSSAFGTQVAEIDKVASALERVKALQNQSLGSRAVVNPLNPTSNDPSRIGGIGPGVSGVGTASGSTAAASILEASARNLARAEDALAAALREEAAAPARRISSSPAADKETGLLLSEEAKNSVFTDKQYAAEQKDTIEQQRIYEAEQAALAKQVLAFRQQQDLAVTNYEKLVAEARARQDAELAALEKQDAQVRLANSKIVNDAHTQAIKEDAIRNPTLPPSVSALDRFKTGLGVGDSGSGIAGTLGQAVKFGVVYGSMYRILGETEKLFKEAFDQAVVFQRATVQLAFQTGQSATASADLANQLQASATQYGLSGAAGIEAGQKAVGLFGASGGGGTDPSKANLQNSIAITAADTVSKLAYATGQSVDKLTGALGATAQARGLGPESIPLLADISTKLENVYGLAHGTVLEGLPGSATASKEAGLSVAEQSTLIAALAARRDVSGEKASTVLDQVLAAVTRDKTNAATIFNSLGITGGTPTEKISNVAEQFRNATPARQEEIATAFGRGPESVNNVGALLEVWADSLKKANQLDFAGTLNKFIDQLNDTLGGNLRRIAGDIKQFSLDISKSGIFDLFLVGAKVFDELLKAADGVLKTFNELLRPLRDLIEVLLLAKGLQAVGLGAKIFPAAASLGEHAAGPVAGIAGRAGAALDFLASPAFLVGAGAVAVGLAANNISKANQAQRDANAALGVIDLNTNASGNDNQTSLINAVQAAADKRSKARGSVFDFSGGSDADAAANALKADIAQAKAINPNYTTPQADANVFGDFSVTQIKVGFDTLKASGLSASDAMAAYNDALKKNEDTLNGLATASVNFGQVAQGVLLKQAALTQQNLGGAQFHLPTDPYYDVLGNKQSRGTQNVSGQDYVDKINKAASEINIGDLIQKNFSNDDVKQGVLDPAKAKTVATLAVSQILAKAKITDPTLVKSIDDLLIPAYVKLFASSVLDLTTAGTSKLASADVTTLIAQAISDGSANAIVPGDLAGQSAASQSTITTIINNIKRNNDATAPKAFAGQYATLAVQIAAKGQIDFKALQLNLNAANKDISSVGAALVKGQSDATQLLTTTISELDLTDTTSLIAAGGPKLRAQADALALKLYLGQIKSITDAATGPGGPGIQDPQVQAALAANSTNYQNYTQAAIAGTAGQQTNAQRAAGLAQANARQGDTVAQARASLQKANADLSAAAAGPGGKESSAYISALTTYNSQIYSTSQAVLAAQQQVNTTAAAKTGSSVAASKAALENASLAVKAAGNDAVLRNIALAGYYQAQQQAADAVLQANVTSASLKLDLTNPLQVAQEAVKAAQAKLASDKKLGLAPDVLNQDTLAIRSAQNQETGAAFTQQLQDTQTADQLGRITHTQYLQYLQNQDQTLRAQIAGMQKTSNGYRQAVDELNQIDGLIQSAASVLNGQFNIGSISLPTVYDVRRYMQTTFGNPAGGPASGGNSTQIFINGADTGAVLQILQQAMGTGNVYTS